MRTIVWFSENVKIILFTVTHTTISLLIIHLQVNCCSVLLFYIWSNIEDKSQVVLVLTIVFDNKSDHRTILLFSHVY